MAFLALHYIKLYSLVLLNTPQVFLGIVLDNCCLMDKDIFIGVIPVDKAIAISNIEPFDNTCYFSGNDFRRFFDFFFIWCFFVFPSFDWSFIYSRCHDGV